jgi:hypothetical protein
MENTIKNDSVLNQIIDFYSLMFAVIQFKVLIIKSDPDFFH